jgi:hypothetical protein
MSHGADKACGAYWKTSGSLSAAIVALFISWFPAQVQTSSRFQLKMIQNFIRVCLLYLIGNENVGCNFKIDVVFCLIFNKKIYIQLFVYQLSFSSMSF